MTDDRLTTLANALREIQDEACKRGSILQPGAAFALGVLADAAECDTYWGPADVASALIGTGESV